eukprot:TRINITY_DN26607_c0_g1_i1.p1 TRINITY_DN26607_c0_g1~~TRINITY_DN26607_c0_g1_i1.p1  ORF type:complete len:775 (+),score=160.59 TRINITY_DN26607_c0_g1_i1:136-2460(+)
MTTFAADWQSSAIPPTIRRPWRVFEEDIEDKLADAAEQNVEIDTETRARLSAVQARGARAAFLEQPEDLQRTYAEVSIMELSAYFCWQRSEASKRTADSGGAPAEFEAAWDKLDCDEKAEWIPEDPRAALSSDGKWASLLADGPPLCGGGEGGVGVARSTATIAKIEPNVGKDAPPPAATPSTSATSAPVLPATGVTPASRLKSEPRAKSPQVRAKSPSSHGKAAPLSSPAATSPGPATKAAQPAPVAGTDAIVDHDQIGTNDEPTSSGKKSSHKVKSAVSKGDPASSIAQALTSGASPASGKKSPGTATRQSPKAGAAIATSPASAVAATPSKRVNADEAAARLDLVARLAERNAKRPANKSVVAPVTRSSRSAAPASQEVATTSGSRSLRSCRSSHGDASDAVAAAGGSSRSKSTVQTRATRGSALPPKKGPSGGAPVISPCHSRGNPIEAAPQRVGGVAQPIRFSGSLASGDLCPEALEAVCCVCNSSEATDSNDLGLCDRCDRAFHQKCHDPPVRWFGRPEDQWFCAPCIAELARLRGLRLVAGDFAWACVPADGPPWPARVLRVDFTSLTDSKPYWVQFFDSGPSVGAWVAEPQICSWREGPSSLREIKDSRRRLAVRLAEADGATPISGGSTVAVEMKPLQQAIKEACSGWIRSGASSRRVSTTTSRGGRRSGGGAASSPAASEEEAEQSRSRARSSGRGSGRHFAAKRPRRQTPAFDAEEEEDDDVQDEAMQKEVAEMRGLIMEARGRQLQLERQLEEASLVASQRQ